MRVSWTNRHGLVALTATLVVLQGVGQTKAQFAPLGNQAQAAPQTQAYPQNQNQVYTPSQYQAYPQIPAYQPVSQAQVPAYGQVAQPQVQVQPQNTTPQYTAPRYATPQYTAMAYQPHSAPPIEAMPTEVQGGGYPEAGVGCNNCQAAPAVNYDSYPSTGCATGGCATGGYGYNTFSNECYGNYGNCGHGGQLLGCRTGCGRRWFGGVYGLLMERDDANCVPLAFSTPTGNVPPYYPTDTETVLTTSNVDIGYQGGAEVRFGATLGGRAFGGYSPCGDACGGGSCGYDSCGGGACGTCCGCGPTHAWEVVYWGIFDDSATSIVTDLTTDANRVYGMMDFRGLEYNPGTGYRSVNVWYDYGPPTVDNTAPYDVEVRSFTTRSTFSAQNIELNLLRLPTICGGGGCGSNCSRYEVTTLAGARFMRFDEDFYFRSDYERMDTNGTGFLAYNAEVDNQLIGFQLGCNGSYRMGRCGRWALHCNSNVGIYGNHIEVHQWMDSPTGGVVRFANGTQSTFNVESDKDDVAMIGELRLGGSYQYSCNWRFYGGWRVIGVSGIALATDQIPTAFITPDQVGKVASNGSLLLHGLQAGVECTY